MESNKVQLTPKDILEKEFKTSMRGYNQEEVDEFLDIVIKDYEIFARELEALKNENQRLKKQVEEARKQPSQMAGATNFDILKRLSNLEKHVFGNKLYD
ncbi:cell division regulator GpsB [Fervidibacillus halotolerans]|uniref:Cell cycle protein GpsB n=1 Tax=Fervidibacillus halotolerans TaxID=2980027 RepID=A0A9E8M0N4_9BACI|nr:cell division regulator GpsB [Fervidibacillus halotolerans]WAA13255.1 cell division regulator GpsB [Fervidibacillus halotolerans]